MQNKENSTFILALLFCLLLSFFLCYRLFLPKEQGWKTIITSDGRGYYAYLPALFIYGDLGFSQVTAAEKKVYRRYDYLPEYLVTVNGKTVNKYFPGEALLLAPFFLLALFFSWLLGLSLDGYSFFFQFFTGLGALFYLFAGVILLRKILRQLYIPDRVTGIVLVAVVLGTNLFYYTIWQASMSHVYSFFAVNGFLFFTLRTMEMRDRIQPLLTGLFLGLVILIRPVNGLIVLLAPFLCADRKELISFFRFLFSGRGLLWIPATLVILAIQPLLWYIRTGEWFLWSYSGEGFYFGNPQIKSVLFGFRKGLFIYTPLLLLSLAGLLILLFRKFFRFLSVFLFLALFTWITASWWNWYYGDGFGMRPYIDFYSVFAILTAIFLTALPPRSGLSLFRWIVVLLVFLNLFQTWQYLQGIIHPYDMNREKYQYVFLRADSASFDCLGGNREVPFYGADLERPCRVYENGFETRKTGWNDLYRQKDSLRAFSGKYIGKLDSIFEFSPGIEMRADTFAPTGTKLFCMASLMLNDSTPGASDGAYLVVSIDSIDGGFNYWNGLKLNGIPQKETGRWRKCTFQWNLPAIRNPKATVKIYVWNKMRKTFLVDDFRFELYRPKENRFAGF